MRVLMLPRSEAARHGGGEATQVAETASALRALGVDVDVSTAPAPALDGYDLVHVFGLTEPSEALLHARRVRSRGLPVVLSPVHQDLREYDARGRYGLAALACRLVRSDAGRARLRLAYRLARSSGRRVSLATLLAASPESQQVELCHTVSALLPGSASESRRITAQLGATAPHVIVPNGASARFDAPSPDEFVSRHGLRDVVLMVGACTSLKNPLRLIEALAGTGLELVVVGGRVPAHGAYYRALVRAARRHRFVTLLPPMPPASLASAYAAARVVALPSWFETCGLTCLEGGLAGCRVAITDRGDTRDYFGDLADYCDPGSVVSIRQAVVAAYHRHATPALRRHVRASFTWTRAATLTLDAYRLVART